MDVFAYGRVGDQANPRSLEPQPGQRQCGCHIGVLGVERRRVARVAFENNGGLAQQIKVYHRLGGGALPAGGWFAPRIDHLVQAPKAGCGDGVDAANSAQQQVQLRVTVPCVLFQALRQSWFGEGADGKHRAFDTALQGR